MACLINLNTEIKTKFGTILMFKNDMKKKWLKIEEYFKMYKLLYAAFWNPSFKMKENGT
jgi:hypothetical protein